MGLGRPTRRQNYVLHEPEPGGADAAELEPVRAAKIHVRVPEPDPELARFGREMNRVEVWTRLICLVVGVVCVPLGIVVLVTMWPHTDVALMFFLAATVCLARGLYGGDSDLRVVDLLSWVGYARHGRLQPPMR